MKNNKKQLDTFTITCNSKQLKSIERACEIYGRLGILQFGFILDELTEMNSGVRNSLEFEKDVKNLLIKYGLTDQSKRFLPLGDIAFEVYRGIHAYEHNKIDPDSMSKCCSCWRSKDNLSNNPIIKIEKGKTI